MTQKICVFHRYGQSHPRLPQAIDHDCPYLWKLCSRWIE